MINSKYLKIIPIKDKYAIFNSLKRDILFIDEDMKARVKQMKLTDEEKEIFGAAKIIVEDNEDELILKKLRESMPFEKKIDLAYVIPSMLCNLNCDYCYIYKNSYNQNKEDTKKSNELNKKVSFEFIDKYISYLLKNNIKNATIQFYGGEPLCNWDAIENIIEYSKDKYSFDFNIITNGTLLDDYKIDFIKKNNIGLGVSIDGDKEINDLHRKYHHSNASVYDSVIKNINKLKENKIAISLTITEEILENSNRVLKNIEKLNILNVNYNLMHTHSYEPELEEHYKKATKYIVNSYKHLYPKGITDDRISRKIEAFTYNKFYFADCKAISCNQIVLLPNGDLTICQGELENKNSVIGNILEGDFDEIIKNKKRINWKNNIPIYNNTCLDCAYISLCGGGCALHAREIKEFQGIDKVFCEHTKYIFEWLLEVLFDQIQFE